MKSRGEAEAMWWQRQWTGAEEEVLLAVGREER